MVFVDISITKDELPMIPSVCPPGFVVQFESSLYLFILMQQYIKKKAKQTRIDGWIKETWYKSNIYIYCRLRSLNASPC